MDTNHFIQILGYLLSCIFILASLFVAGLGLTIKEVFEPIKRIRLVALALIANFVLVPALAYALSLLFKTDSSTQIGLLIMACCAGAPFLPKLVTMAKGNVAYTVGPMLLLIVATICLAPIFLPFLIPGLAINPWHIASPLIMLMLTPLIAGLLINTWKPNIAGSLKPFMGKTASLSLIILAVLSLGKDYKLIVSVYGTGLYAITTLFTVGTLLIGYVFGGSNRSEKFVMMLGTGMRNIPAALLIAAINFPDKQIVTVVIIGSLVQFVFALLLARIYRRYN